MATNFTNSAGTDLDSLFYTDNGNGGAIGLLTSNSVDLGNKYTNKSTLGYNVGYANSAGTDIGYLRGSMTAPEGTITLTRNSISSNNWSGKCTCSCTGEGTCEGSASRGWRKTKFTYKINTSSVVSSVAIYLDVYLNGSYANNAGGKYHTSDTNFSATATCSGGYADYCGTGASISAAGTSIGISSSNKGKWYSYQMSSSTGDINKDLTRWLLLWASASSYANAKIRIKAVLTNAVGSKTIYSSEITNY